MSWVTPALIITGWLAIRSDLRATAQKQAMPVISKEGKACLDCHQSSTPGIIDQWKHSAHCRKSVDCYSCHKANAADPATFDHYGHHIAVIVTPNYCNRCHQKEV
jgi:hypothetical protein